MQIGGFVEAKCRVGRRTRSLIFMSGEITVGDRVVATANGVWKGSHRTLMLSAPPAQIPLEKTIVLVVPAEGMHDEARLRASLVSPGRAVRVLLCVSEDVDPLLAASVAKSLAAIGAETQILLHTQAQSLGTGAFELHAPADMSRNDQIEFALALSDVVLNTQGSDPHLVKVAELLRKPSIPLGNPVPVVFQDASITRELDPEKPGWLSNRRSLFGRLEQAILELFAFGWRGWDREGRAESAKRLKQCVRSDWKVRAYFAPEEWRQIAPDRATSNEPSPIDTHFEAMDRSALYGSYIYRDLIWATHFAAAFAVFAAVAGHIWKSWSLFWGGIEFIALVFVLSLIFASRYFALRDRWTACRLGAEQLRIARMSLPLLVLPSALATTNTTPAAEGHGSKEAEFGARALEEVKRAVRDHGLPRTAAPLKASDASAWVHCIVADQIDYHRRNHGKLEHVESWVGYATAGFFIIALFAVIIHPFAHWNSLLLLTAAGPAFAAALHGAGTRLGIVHRAALSLEMEHTLRQIDSALVKLMDGTHSAEDPQREVRRLAFAAAEAMGSENRSWHVLVRRYRDELP